MHSDAPRVEQRSSFAIARAGLSSARALRTIATIAVMMLIGMIIWVAGDVLLLIFTGLLMAILLIQLSEWLRGISKLSYGWSLTIVLSTLFIVSVLMFTLFATRIASEAGELTKTVQSTWQQTTSRLSQYEWAPKLDGSKSIEQLQNMRGNWIASVAGIFSTSFGALSSTLLILFIGIFTAADPQLYRRGLIHLVPLAKRDRTSAVLDELFDKLWWWIIGRLLSMTVVGVATAIGLWLLGIRFAATIGLLSGLLTFIPNFGPILSAIPAILLGLTNGVMPAIYVVALYLGVQAVESNLLTPLVQQKNIKLPPVLNVAFQILLGFLFGIAGLIVAPPIAVVVMILTQRFYVEDYLGDKSLNDASVAT